jgi:DNA-binding NarL/FixJ family response regulator
MFILSAYGDTKLVRSCFNCGIDGFALKTHSVETLRSGIVEVMQNRIFLAEGLQVAPQINDKELNSPSTEQVVNDRFLLKQQLTKREVQILKLIVSGMNNRQIAKELYISHETVGVHKKNIKKKFDVNSTPSLIHFVQENRIFE